MTLINGLPFLLIGVFTPVWFGQREKGMNFELLHSPSSLVHPLVSNESMLGWKQFSASKKTLRPMKSNLLCITVYIYNSVLLSRFWVSIRSNKKQPVKKIWGRILDLAWLKLAVAALNGADYCALLVYRASK